MKDEYDFSNAGRGKFHRPNLRLIPPVRLEPEVLNFLATRASARTPPSMNSSTSF